jgi:hypothetical protein
MKVFMRCTVRVKSKEHGVKGTRLRAQGSRQKDVISYRLYGKDSTEYLGSSIKSTHSPKDTEQLITYN